MAPAPIKKELAHVADVFVPIAIALVPVDDAFLPRAIEP